MADETYLVFDAAYPPADAPPGARAVLGYVGRNGFTPHVWTMDEWLRFQHLKQYPCWLPNLAMPPEIDADEAVASVQALGWAVEPKPRTRAIVLDLETRLYPDWSSEWGVRVAKRGYWPVDYGSMATVLGNKAYDNWAADWDGIPALQPGKRINGDQYAAGIAYGGTQIDLSVIDQEMWLRGGIGPRH